MQNARGDVGDGPNMTELAHFVIYGHLPRKSNSRQIVGGKGKGKRMVIKSPQAREYERSFLEQIKFNSNIPSLAVDYAKALLSVKADIYYPWRLKGDLSGELLLDCLEKSGVIDNDRYVIQTIFNKKYDKENPRAEVWIYEARFWEWD